MYKVSGQLGLKSSRPLSQLGPGSTRPESTRPGVFSEHSQLGLNEMYVWFLLAYIANFFHPILNIKMVFGEKIPKMGTFSDFVTIFVGKCYNQGSHTPFWEWGRGPWNWEN